MILANAVAGAVDMALMPSDARVFLKEALYTEAARLAGRPVEVEETTDGKFIVLWLHFQASPPPKADTEAKALAGFIAMMLQRKGTDDNLPEVDTKEDTGGTDNRSQAVDN